MAGVVCGGKESRKREIERKSQTVMKTLSLLDSIRLLVARFNCYRVIIKVEIQASERFRKRANWRSLSLKDRPLCHTPVLGPTLPSDILGMALNGALG